MYIENPTKAQLKEWYSCKKKEAYQYFLDGYGCAVINAKEKEK